MFPPKLTKLEPGYKPVRIGYKWKLFPSNPLTLEENKLPISPISPQDSKRKHRETCLPLHVCRSTTYTSLPASENGELEKADCANTAKDFHFNEKGITETSF